jgi:hypothetical protein
MADNTSGRNPGPVRVPMKVDFAGTWLSWVGATTGCLSALGVACDTVDVIGHSGYAFQLTIHKALCPSGPTSFDWSTLQPGVWRLGRSTAAFHAPEGHEKGNRSDRTTAHCRAAFEIARREVEAGRPCVVWGAYMPEFAIAIGITDDDAYEIESFKRMMNEPQPPVKFDEVEAAGGPYVLAFPTPTSIPRAQADRDSVADAAGALARGDVRDGYGHGSAAYDAWIGALKGNTAEPFGNAYNAQCWADARQLAARFVDRLAGRNAAAADPLARAHGALVRAADALKVLAQRFPFPGQPDQLTQANRDAAVEALRAAQAADADAAAALAEASRKWSGT